MTIKISIEMDITHSMRPFQKYQFIGMYSDKLSFHENRFTHTATITFQI